MLCFWCFCQQNHLVQYKPKQERLQHVRTWLTLPGDGPQTMNFIDLRSSYTDFQAQSGHDMIHGRKNGLPICKIMQCRLPCLHPALFRLLGDSVLLGLDGSVRFWSESLGEMFVVPCYPSTFLHHNSLHCQWSNKYPLASFQCWGQHFETVLRGLFSFSGFCRHNLQLHCPTAQGELYNYNMTFKTLWNLRPTREATQNRRTQTPTSRRQAHTHIHGRT